MGTKGSVDHYAAVLADLEARRAQIDATIATLKALQAGGIAATAGGAQVGTVIDNSGDSEIAVDEFHKLTVGSAINKYLGMRGRKPATTAEIVEALTKGGQAGSEGNNFTVVVSNTLNRLQAADGSISKVKRGLWGLKEWYDKKPSNEG